MPKVENRHSISTALDEHPLSVNDAWEGRRFKTPEYKEFEEICLYTLPKKRMLRGIVEIEYRFHLKYHKTSDYDNFIKCFQDILVKRGYIEDDRFIYKATIYKIPSEREQDRIEVIIKPYTL